MVNLGKVKSVVPGMLASAAASFLVKRERPVGVPSFRLRAQPGGGPGQVALIPTTGSTTGPSTGPTIGSGWRMRFGAMLLAVAAALAPAAVIGQGNKDLINNANTTLLPYTSQASITTLVNTVSSRVATVVGGDNLAASTVAPLPTPTSASSMSLSDNSAGSQPDPVSLWSGLNFNALHGDTNDLDWDGTVTSGVVGMDGRINPYTMMGVGLSHAVSPMNYDTGSNGGGEDYDYATTGITPYIGWSARNWRLWSALGYGDGDITVEQDGKPYQSPSTQSFIAFGALGEALDLRSDSSSPMASFTLSLQWDAFLSKVNVEGGEMIDEDTLRGRRLRVMLISERQENYNPEGIFIPRLELGLRYDRNESVDDAGGEISAGLRYNPPDRGFTLEGNLRSLISHAYNEWSIDLTLRALALPERGVYLTLRPMGGDAEGAAPSLWEDTAALADHRSGAAPQHLDVEIGYGLGATVLHTPGTLTPYLKMVNTDHESIVSVGGNFSTGHLGFDAAGSRDDAGHYGVELRANVNW